MKDKLTVFFWPAIAGLLLALLILERWILPPASDSLVLSTAPASYAPAVQAAAPSVVNIYTAKLVNEAHRLPFDDPLLRRLMELPSRQQRVERALGSGVIVTDEGHILTNNHVIAGADAIQVMLHDGRSANAVVIGTDPATDLAVLQVSLPDLQPVSLGNSDTARVGDVVLAIGNPLGFRHTVSQGIVSAVGRFGLQSDKYEDYIQTDALIHQGNSGGALIDVQGRLLGINTLIYTSDNQHRSASTGIGISLAIPVNLAVTVLHDLINYGEVIRGWLGVNAESVLLQDGSRALNIVAVAEYSPAQRAGLQVGDLITRIDGEPVVDGRLTMYRIALLRPGDSLAISLLRNGQSLALTAVVGMLEQPGDRPAP